MSILLVHIHLDALVSDGSPVRDAMADDTKLPYFDDQVPTFDGNDGTAHVSARILSQPLANANLSLAEGIHLHWALPDALTKGVQAKGEVTTTFPNVPNRWLVIRSRGGTTIEEQWVVESDYLHPIQDAQGNYVQVPGSVTIPSPPPDPDHGSDQPFRYLGRQLKLADWQASDANSPHVADLTAVGPVKTLHVADHVKATFAAFYPNCHSVFGFHDEAYTAGHIPAGLQYDVIGWYANAQQDVLAQFLHDHQNHQDRDALCAALQDRFRWKLTLAQGQNFPKDMLCYARLTFQHHGVPAKTRENAFTTGLAIGNTGTEALSAYLAQAIDSSNKEHIEEQYFGQF